LHGDLDGVTFPASAERWRLSANQQVVNRPTEKVCTFPSSENEILSAGNDLGTFIFAPSKRFASGHLSAFMCFCRQALHGFPKLLPISVYANRPLGRNRAEETWFPLPRR